MIWNFNIVGQITTECDFSTIYEGKLIIVYKCGV